MTDTTASAAGERDAMHDAVHDPDTTTDAHPARGTATDAAAAAVQAITRASRILERASTELSLTDFRMLSAISDGEARATRLAARLAVGKPAVSAGVDSLERRGYITRSRVESDQRASALSLTEAGVEVHDRVEADMVMRLRALCARMDDGDELIGLLGRLGEAIEEFMREHVALRGRV
jgi:DNA-binding MarR family transcriptional regulator